MTLPGYPGLRLWDDSIRALGASSRNLKPSRSIRRNRAGRRPTLRLLLDQAQARAHLFARTCAIEQTSARALIEELAPGEAIMGLVQVAYRLDITDREMMRRQFQFSRALPSASRSNVSSYRTIFPRSPR